MVPKIATTLSFSMFLTISLPTMASEVVSEAEGIANLIESVTGTEEIVDFTSTRIYSAVYESEGLELRIPRDGESSISIDEINTENFIEMYLPSEFLESEGVITSEGTIVYTSPEEPPVTFAVPTLEGGFRTLFTIEDYSAPNEYRFDFVLPAGSYMVYGQTVFGEDFFIDEVDVFDQEGNLATVIEAPWAKDANGNPLNTWYEIDGHTLIQHIEFDYSTAFPIVADPTVWQISVCVAAIAGAILLVVAGGITVGKWIAGVGGIKWAAKLLLRARVPGDLPKAMRATGVGLLGAVGGVVTIREACRR
ncbi:MAG: hypothetical protein FWF59_01825 [Turicibacter sp.]|nr:hypothetical protein [Turicibacter sp.]